REVERVAVHARCLTTGDLEGAANIDGESTHRIRVARRAGGVEGKRNGNAVARAVLYRGGRRSSQRQHDLLVRGSVAYELGRRRRAGQGSNAARDGAISGRA